jgi:hypothetical protein
MDPVKVRTVAVHTYDGVEREVGACYEVEDPGILETVLLAKWVVREDDPAAAPSTSTPATPAHPPPLNHEHAKRSHHREK